MKLNEIVDNTFTDISGVVLFEWLESHIIAGTEVDIDLRGCNPMSIAFHENSFLKIYKKHGENNFKKYIKILR